MTVHKEDINDPYFVSVCGVLALIFTPSIEEFIIGLSWKWVRILNVVAYTCHIISISVPGRIDSEAQRDLTKQVGKNEETETKKEEEEEKEQQEPSIKPSPRSIMTPASWAFAIWGVIFLGELIFIIGQFFIPESDPFSKLITDITAFFVVANFFHIIWAATFRPKYPGALMIISTLSLFCISFSLSKAHEMFSSFAASEERPFSNLRYCLFFLPLTLHFGWTTAAGFVNLNSGISKCDWASSRDVALLGHLSVVLAAVTGVSLTLKRSSPVFGGVIAWALFAIAVDMKNRINSLGEKKKEDDAKEDDARPFVQGVRTQYHLSALGGVLCCASAVRATYTLFK